MEMEAQDSSPKLQRGQLHREKSIVVFFKVLDRVVSSACTRGDYSSLRLDLPKRLGRDSALHSHKAGSGAHFYHHTGKHHNSSSIGIEYSEVG